MILSVYSCHSEMFSETLFHVSGLFFVLVCEFLAVASHVWRVRRFFLNGLIYFVTSVSLFLGSPTFQCCFLLFLCLIRCVLVVWLLLWLIRFVLVVLRCLGSSVAVLLVSLHKRVSLKACALMRQRSLL